MSTKNKENLFSIYFMEKAKWTFLGNPILGSQNHFTLYMTLWKETNIINLRIDKLPKL